MQEQANIKSGISVDNNGFKRSIFAEETNFIEKNAEEKFLNRLRRIPYEQDQNSIFLHPDVRFPTRNYASLRTIMPTGKNIIGRTNTKNDKTRNKRNYHVDVIVLTDSGIWEL
ncbi:hypothetical protein CHS0354_019068 [Potamilus streckersoni]|uniref:Uncharacterized protein n=1 Tax=Potamilus streckersoni TaxID=2493646 RepID=A0AAE0T655_9BIVA|nr:hypothetical protein CHS0354_019068 [Potamilus streckersoni]